MSKRSRQPRPVHGRRQLPSICVDEHIAPQVADAFRPDFRVIEVAKTSRFKGRDEKDFLPELYRENAVFVTSDAAFVERAIEVGMRHAGIVYVPPQLAEDEKVFIAEVVAALLKAECMSSPHAFRDCVAYPGYDGLHVIRDETDRIVVSWNRLFRMLRVQ